MTKIVAKNDSVNSLHLLHAREDPHSCKIFIMSEISRRNNYCIRSEFLSLLFFLWVASFSHFSHLPRELVQAPSLHSRPTNAPALESAIVPIVQFSCWMLLLAIDTRSVHTSVHCFHTILSPIASSSSFAQTKCHSNYKRIFNFFLTSSHRHLPESTLECVLPTLSTRPFTESAWKLSFFEKSIITLPLWSYEIVNIYTKFCHFSG